MIKILAVVCSLSFFFMGYSAEQNTVSIPCSKTGKIFNASVFLPQDYAKSGFNYSTVYLLHGYSGDYGVWAKIAPLGSFSDKYQVIIVCPDGNFSSWYVNSVCKINSNFDSYISHDVIEFIDKTYRTIKNESGRAIIGTSMGGHGATTLLAKHPDLFCGAGSISGIMDLTEFPGQWDLDQIFGDFDHNKMFWKSNSFYMLLENLQNKNKGLILDVGVSDFAIKGNRLTHEKLIVLGIPHDFYERPGNHTLQYAHDVIECHFIYFSKRLSRPGPRQP